MTARTVSLSSLLDGIEAGAVVLPDFQRDFDWNSGEVIALVATLLRGWPAGSLLLMRGKPEFFLTRAFEYAPRQARSPEYVVLDGQQRLTALYLALRDRGPAVYVLSYDAPELIDTATGAELLEERMRTINRATWDGEYSFSRQVSERLLPLSSLSSASDFFEWRDTVAAAAPAVTRGALSDDLSNLYRRILGTINHYDFPCVVLEPDLPSEAVARIFERINRSGRRLNTFDLLVARAYAPDWNLRDKWETVTREYRRLDSFLADDGLPILQLISLHDRNDVRQPALLDLAPSRVREAWDDAVASMDVALAATERFGAITPDSLPYPAQLLTLGGLAWEDPSLLELPVVERWFWASALGTTYDVASSTRVVSDLRQLHSAIQEGAEIDRPFVSLDSLAAATRRRSPATWRTFMALLTRAGAADPLTGEDANADSEDSGVAVSLFPTTHGVGEGYHLRVFGLVRVTRATARRAKSQPLVQMLLERAESAKDVDELLTRQCLPPLEQLVSLAANPISLLERRVELAVSFLRDKLDNEIVQLARSVV